VHDMSPLYSMWTCYRRIAVIVLRWLRIWESQTQGLKITKCYMFLHNCDTKIWKNSLITSLKIRAEFRYFAPLITDLQYFLGKLIKWGIRTLEQPLQREKYVSQQEEIRKKEKKCQTYNTFCLQCLRAAHALRLDQFSQYNTSWRGCFTMYDWIPTDI
jgi:hypothetical protein